MSYKVSHEDGQATVTCLSYRGGAWVAVIKGPHPKFRLDRQFMAKHDVTTAKSNVYRELLFMLPLTERALYEYRDLGGHSRGGQCGFWRVQDGELVKVNLQDAYVIAERQAVAV